MSRPSIAIYLLATGMCSKEPSFDYQSTSCANSAVGKRLLMKSAGKSDNGRQHRAKQRPNCYFEESPRTESVPMNCEPHCASVKHRKGKDARAVLAAMLVQGYRERACNVLVSQQAKQTMQSSAVLRLGVTSPSHVVPASFSSAAAPP